MNVRPDQHGTITGYARGCRCDGCKDANSAYRAAVKAKRVLVGGVLVHPNAPHGTSGGYTNYGCRCQPCKDAFAAGLMSAKKRRMLERVEVDGRMVHPNAPHGTSNAYGNYGCRCRQCTDVWSAESYERVARRRASGAA